MSRLITAPMLASAITAAAVAMTAIHGADAGGTGGGVPIHCHGTPSGFDAEQVANAATIVRVGQQMGVPQRGQVIAVATALQESSLRNLSGGDRDSVGLFQQRPSQGWGTYDQVHDPAHAAHSFYVSLEHVDGWSSMPVAEAAQDVQRSAYPGAYAKWENDAAALVACTK